MPRFVSVWLPRWPILRFLAAQPRSSAPREVDPERPFVLTVEASGEPRARFGRPGRVAVADTPGAAWALSGSHPASRLVLPSGKEAKALAHLPIAALRLAEATRRTLRRLGFKHVGALIDMPRAPFAA